MQALTKKDFQRATGLKWKPIKEQVFDMVRARPGVRASSVFLIPDEPPFVDLGGGRWRFALCFDMDHQRPGDEIYAASVELVVEPEGAFRLENCQWGERIR